MTMQRWVLILVAAWAWAGSASCREEHTGLPAAGSAAQDHRTKDHPDDHDHPGDHEHDADDEHGYDHAHPADRRDVFALPPAVRRNLGITFATVERRMVARTLRVPGRFELAPNARREYRTMLGGRVELHVAQYQPVEPGTLLYTLDSPAWRELQERLNETLSAIRQSAARVATTDPLMEAHRKHEESLRVAVDLWTQRVQQLEQTAAGVITAEDLAQARSLLAAHRAELSEVLEKEAELNARKVEVESELAAARERMDLLLMTASSLLGIDKAVLEAPAPAGMERHGHIEEAAGHEHPMWRELRIVEVRAAGPGVVESLELTNGAWAAETSLVLTTVQPELIRFRARGLQSDLGLLRDGLPGRIVPPSGGSIALQDTMSGTITLGLGGDADERTVEILMTPESLAGWARSGVAAHLEIVVEGGESPELAIPVSATIRDGLTTVFFRRDPANPDQVQRIEAHLGISDGRWVEVHGGVREGDEVVLDGIYQLMLASSAAAPAGGHFHADGTFHGEDDH